MYIFNLLMIYKCISFVNHCIQLFSIFKIYSMGKLYLICCTLNHSCLQLLPDAQKLYVIICSCIPANLWGLCHVWDLITKKFIIMINWFVMIISLGKVVHHFRMSMEVEYSVEISFFFWLKNSSCANINIQMKFVLYRSTGNGHCRKRCWCCL